LSDLNHVKNMINDLTKAVMKSNKQDIAINQSLIELLVQEQEKEIKRLKQSLETEKKHSLFLKQRIEQKDEEKQIERKYLYMHQCDEKEQFVNELKKELHKLQNKDMF